MRVSRLLALAALVLALMLAASGCAGSARNTERAVAGGGGRDAVVAVERFFSTYDTAAEYKLIWGKKPSSSILRDDQRVFANLDSSIVRINPTASLSEASSFLASFEKSTADVVTLVGHNDHGVFKFADGSSVTLLDLPLTGPPVAVVSCESLIYRNGNTAGLATKLSLSIAGEIESTFNARIRDLSAPPSIEEIQGILDEVSAVLTTQHRHRRLLALTLKTGGIISAPVVTVRIFQFEGSR